MKSFFSAFICLLSFITPAAAQLMGQNGLKNTIWSGIGNFYPPLDMADGDDYEHSYSDHTQWNGFLDTFQGRMSAGVMTIDAALQWKVQTNYCDNGQLRDVKFKYHDGEINFAAKPNKCFEFGAGTCLDWQLGPAPEHCRTWEYRCHLTQGGLGFGAPGSCPVSGATYYANCVTESFSRKKGEVDTESVAARFFIYDFMQVAVAIHDDFITGCAVQLSPADNVVLAIAFDRAFIGDGNLYAGISYGITDNLKLNTWLSSSNIGGKSDNGQTGFGCSVELMIGPVLLCPESSITTYENTDYSYAGYAGMRITHEFGDALSLSAWSSFAIGSKDKTWKNNTSTKGNKRGYIFDVRPDITYFFKTCDAFTASFEYQKINTYRDKNYDNWSFGVFWVHVF